VGEKNLLSLGRINPRPATGQLNLGKEKKKTLPKKSMGAWPEYAGGGVCVDLRHKNLGKELSVGWKRLRGGSLRKEKKNYPFNQGPKSGLKKGRYVVCVGEKRRIEGREFTARSLGN